MHALAIKVRGRHGKQRVAHLVIDVDLEDIGHVLGIPGILCEGEVSSPVEAERHAICIGPTELFTPEGCD